MGVTPLLEEIQLFQAAITTSDVTKYTCPTGFVVMLKDFDIMNTTGGALTVRINIVPLAGTAGTTNAILYDYSIGAAGAYAWRGTQVLSAGAFISVRGSGAGLTITASGVRRQL